MPIDLGKSAPVPRLAACPGGGRCARHDADATGERHRHTGARRWARALPVLVMASVAFGGIDGLFYSPDCCNAPDLPNGPGNAVPGLCADETVPASIRMRRRPEPPFTLASVKQAASGNMSVRRTKLAKPVRLPVRVTPPCGHPRGTFLRPGGRAPARSHERRARGQPHDSNSEIRAPIRSAAASTSRSATCV